MKSTDHLRQGERYLSAASCFTVDPCGPAGQDAVPTKKPQTNQLLIELANAHFNAATAAALIERKETL